MDNLPLELTAKIASYLPREDSNGALVRPNISSVSRQWKSAIEMITFRELKVKSTELAEFAANFSGSKSHRRGLLKALGFSIVLPDYSNADCAIYESNQDRLVNDKVASDAVAALFDILSTWGSHRDNAVELIIDAYSPMDAFYCGFDKRAQDERAARARIRADLFALRYKHSYIRIADVDKLPTVPCIKALYLDNGDRHFYPGSVVALAAKTPTLEQLIWVYTEPDVYLTLRRIIRDELFQWLMTFGLARSTARSLEIDINSHVYHDNQRLPDMTPPWQYDPLCAALHHSIGSKVKTLSYRGPLDAALFWPYGELQGPREPFWSSLTKLEVTFSAASPNGRWYFKAPPDHESHIHPSNEPLPADQQVSPMPPGYGTEEDTDAAYAYELAAREMPGGDNSEFRTVPDDEVMLPLLAAFARAAAQMPALKNAYLATPVPEPQSVWFVLYGAPGITCGGEELMVAEGEPEPPLNTPRVYFGVGDWRPSAEVVDLFRRVGEERYMQDTNVVFLA
ncbi:hypothetical protein C8A00DRAFT_30990 [Chaetomidium leptoderma]|uniref:F-box domain-containing protein n=1 Tax=Chaetomidium leptoderma TaxID=669021 RepID=A0AAN6VS07_9PEZI|nr:hypothetical protein C8A00DRAFT_30990 [Chaetomidium leptoderma]